MNGNSACADTVDERHLSNLPLNNRNLLGIFAFTDIRGILRENFFHGVFAGKQRFQNGAIPGGRKRGTIHFRPSCVRYPELPACGGSSILHRFEDFQFAVLDVGERDLCILMGQDLDLLNRFIHHPVFILKPPILVPGFFGVVNAGIKVIAAPAFFIGGDGSHLLRTRRVRIDGDFPAFHIFAGIGFLVEPADTLFAVQPGVYGILAACDKHRVEAQLSDPVDVLCGKFHHGVASQGKIPGNGIAVFICGKFADSFSAGIPDLKCPAAQMVAGVGCFHNLDTAILRVCKGDAGGLVYLNRHSLYFCVELPIRIVCRDFSGIQRSGLQTRNGYGAICPSHKRRILYGICAVGVIIQADFPATQILACVGFLHEHNTSGIALVVKTHRGCLPGGNRDLLGIGTGAAVQSVQTGICVPQFLDVVCACGQPRYGQLAAGIGGIRPGYQIGAGGIAVNPELPARQVLTVLRGFCQADIPQRRCLYLEIGIQSTASCIVQRNGRLVTGTGHVPNIVTGAGCRGQIPGCGEHRGFRNISSSCNIQGVAALGKAGSVSVGKAEIGQNPVGIIGAAGIPGKLNCGRIAAGTAAKAGNILCGLDCGYQAVVAGGEPGHRGGSCVIEHITGGAAFVGAVPVKTAGVTQAADDFINQYLRCYPQRHIGVTVLFRGGNADGMVPLLIAVQKNKPNGFPPCRWYCRCRSGSHPGQQNFRMCWHRNFAMAQCSTAVHPHRQRRHTGQNASPCS